MVPLPPSSALSSPASSSPRGTTTASRLSATLRQAFRLLVRYEKPATRSQADGGAGERRCDVLLEQALAHAQQPLAAGLLTELAYGALREWRPLGDWLAVLTQRRLKDTPPKLRSVLRLLLYGLARLDKTPEAVWVDACVSLARQEGLSAAQRQLVNALGRRVAALPREQRLQQLEQTSPFPAWWHALLQQQGLSEQALQQQQHLQRRRPAMGIRVNTLGVAWPQYLAQLAECGIAFVQPYPETLPEVLVLPAFTGLVTSLPGFAQGQVVVQDVGSSVVGAVLPVQPGQLVVDLCAAPGTKTMQLAARMQGQGCLLAVDSRAQRLQRVQDNAQRLQLPSDWLVTVVAEAQHWPFPNGLAHAVLVDAPCSGTGTTRRHPDTWIDLKPEHLEGFATLQRALLTRAVALVRPGGYLVYSTCSLAAEENEAVVQAVLQTLTPDWKLLEQVRHWPGAHADGFFHALLHRQPSE